MPTETDKTNTEESAKPEGTDSTNQNSEFAFPANTPLVDMTTEQQAEYWREKAQKHEKAWQASNKINPKEVEELRLKAKKLDDIEEAQKTESQKLIERAEHAEKELQATQLRVLRAEVAAKKGLPIDLIKGDTQEEIEAFADALAAFGGGKPTKPDMGGGKRGDDIGDGKKQLTSIQGMTTAQIVQARKEGLLDDLLAGK